MEDVSLFEFILINLKIGIQCIGIAVIAAGALQSIHKLCTGALFRSLDLNAIRFQFGTSVILGLEFMVGADIIGSLVRPTYYTIGILAIIVIIRTILSYFLNLELEQLSPEQKKQL